MGLSLGLTLEKSFASIKNPSTFTTVIFCTVLGWWFYQSYMASIKLELYVLKTTTLERKVMEELNTSLKSVSLM